MKKPQNPDMRAHLLEILLRFRRERRPAAREQLSSERYAEACRWFRGFYRDARYRYLQIEAAVEQSALQDFEQYLAELEGRPTTRRVN